MFRWTRVLYSDYINWCNNYVIYTKWLHLFIEFTIIIIIIIITVIVVVVVVVGGDDADDYGDSILKKKKKNKNTYFILKWTKDILKSDKYFF